jgi:TonB-linked SusC/RagA family outer membrane protein
MYKFYFDYFVQPPGRTKKLLMVMKLTTLLLFFTMMQVSAMTYAQKVSLNAKNSSLSNVLDQVSDQTGYNFFYSNSALNDSRPITIIVKNAELQEVLQQIFAGQPLEFTIQDKNVVIREKEAPLKDGRQIQTNPERASTILTGKVTDERGNTLPGVTVKVKGTSIGGTTNQKGRFVVAITVPNAVLQFSFIGFITREIAADQLQSPATIVLKEDISRLNEVQVIAYGTTTKRQSTGDQTSVPAAEIAKYPTTNVLDVLQGSVPGLAVTKNSGNPGSSYKVQLRGINGVSSRPPLYIVDGVPYGSMNSPNTFSTNTGYLTQNRTLGGATPNGITGQGGDPLNFINPADIESITVLKDAEATAIYGTRAADGVIIITTKKGKPGNMRTDVSFYNGYTSVTRLPNLLNLQQYLQMRKEGKRNDNSAISPTDYDINGAWDTTRSTDWAKRVLGGTGRVTNAQASVSGGTNNTQYRISTGYNRQTNVTDLNGSNQSANVGFSINSKSDNNKFSVQLTGSYFYNSNTITQADITGLILAPNAPEIYNPDGTLNFQGGTFQNPFVAKNLMNNTKSGNLTSSAVVSYRPTSDLEFRVNLGYNRQQINEFLGTPLTALQPSPNATRYSTFVTDNVSWWSIEPQANFNKDISKGKLSITLGSSLQSSVDESTQLKVTGYSSDLLLPAIPAGTTVTPIVSSVYAPYKLSGIFGRAGYTWDNKYMLEASGRYDGSSHFGADRQFHLFSAIGAGWVFSEENLFKKHLSFLSFGKLRGSYGVTGRDAIPIYQYLDTYSSSVAYQGVPGLVPTGLPNPQLSWESTTKSEIGLELQFLKGRIAFETNFYRNRTSNLLSATPLSQVDGVATITQNIPAVVQNQGFDVTLTGYGVRNKDFTWSTTVLFTRDRNTLLNFPGLDKSNYANSFFIGQPINIKRVYSFAGVNPQTGIYQFNSKAGTVVPALSLQSGVDNFVNVNTNPEFFGSVKNSFRYKRFTFDFLFRFVKQTGVSAFGQQGTIPPGFSINNNFSNLVLNRWQKPGDITDIQRYGTGLPLVFGQSSAIQSDHAFGDASYIRFQNASLTYMLPESVLSRLHVQSLQVYVQGDNLLTISKYGAIDPESQSFSSVPPLRTITAGLRLSL